MAEEHRSQTPEGHRLCSNNCGFLGSSTTMNHCSNCNGDFCLKKQTCLKSTFKSSISTIAESRKLVSSIKDSTPNLDDGKVSSKEEYDSSVCANTNATKKDKMGFLSQHNKFRLES
ncbi:hypothetical protein Bca4012_050103 [Brassica carinata]